MKNLAYLMMLIAVAITACNPKNDDVRPVSLELDPSQSITFSAEATAAENKTITVTSSGKWTVASSADWCVITKNQDNMFTVSAKANESATLSRTATITVIAVADNFSATTKTIAVEQKKLGEASITVATPVISLTHNQTTASEIAIVTNQSLWGYTLSSGDSSWLTVDKGEGKLTITASVNTGAARTATITFAAGEGNNSAQAVVTINQGEAPKAIITPASTSVTMAHDQTIASEVGVNTNQPLWGYTLSSGDSSWLTVSKGDGKLIIIATANTGAARNATITLAAGEGSNSAQAEVAIMQTADPKFMEMVSISAGTFMMGAPDADTNALVAEKPQHQVTLSAFRIGKYEITNTQFAYFLNNASGITVMHDGNVSYYAQMTINGQIRDLAQGISDQEFDKPFTNKYNPTTQKWAPDAGFENHPAVHLSHYGAMAYAQWAGGTLPTEAQWEYACRAGTTTPWYWGATADGASTYEWIDLAVSQTNSVGKKQPNGWGLYDMVGNASEWCLDTKYDYTANQQTDPITHNESERYGVYRGGAPNFESDIYGRSSVRSTLLRTGTSNYTLGFRIVKPVN